MSGTGSSAQSECSAYTVSSNIKSEKLVSFRQRFKHFNPEAQLPHMLETNSLGGQSLRGAPTPYDANNNQVQHFDCKPLACAIPCPDIGKHCPCNIHIHYNISYSIRSHAFICKCGSNNCVFHSDLEQESCQHSHQGEEGFICDV